MKIKIVNTYDEDGAQSQEMFIDEVSSWKSRDLAMDCPEDATLSRSMTNGNEIISLMQKAYIAGKNGEKFEWETEI